MNGEILGSRELLRRAIENVLRNGIRYSPQAFGDSIDVQENEREATIAVRDFGPGVPEEALARIFDPFFRVEDARNANGGGSGHGFVDCEARGATCITALSPQKTRRRGCACDHNSASDCNQVLHLRKLAAKS